MERVRFPQISSRAFEHPADRAALTALRKVPGFDLVVRKSIGLMRERSLRAIFLASAVRVGGRQLAKLDAIYEDCLATLDVQERPDLYVSQTPFVNAGAVGAERPFIVLNSATLELLDDAEMRQVLGHELAHILSGHVVYKTMFAMLLRFSTDRLGLPLVGLARSAILAALAEWDRKSELSSDRAGVLCVQDPTVTYRSFMKMAGGRAAEQMDVGAFIEQADEYLTGGDALDSIFKLLNLLGVRHPFWALRLAEVRKWMEQGSYSSILAGDYPRRGEDASTRVVEELAESAKTYKETAAETRDPLMQTLRDIGSQIVEGGGSLWSTLKSRFSRGHADAEGHETTGGETTGGEAPGGEATGGEATGGEDDGSEPPAGDPALDDEPKGSTD